ncbi:hypothetical protein LEP1GSC034_2866 [Leptospira interrogans str. 2003000735]|uniref:Uncharacterized protein n=11 Tax=Leptospira interrogans TaxID=173 RepID=A0A0E2DMJ8_LEPIR|nr:hypothetical protein G436_1198 [Leptospira interrogans serovar Hardjo str. Norma]EJP05208.1 hypothetical protein LEP1GSC007_1028 [Leptospira interrogans serovar Bulgarica str. Mallika]EJP13413.1 hypothetical protein LEP1GSC080_2710 [Leptospira interrogans str. FPW2026]EKN86260.1 hypothetical protein LEP1GSC027_2275 [Leptospira interrogans str. 2002000624]EKO07810.1 hypothetical protein LEP1GSC077_3563 [Leptospira interrogans str. C10069]EKO98984.1 hypothetical protein LEP1GSC057_0678 [Lepto
MAAGFDSYPELTLNKFNVVLFKRVRVINSINPFFENGT